MLAYGQVCNPHKSKVGTERLTLTLSSTGSTLHALRCLQHPRWEDYNYERIDDTDNRMYWLGDGQTWNEKTLTGDRKLGCRVS